MKEVVLDENGRETDASIRRRASEITGFKMALIIPKYAWMQDGVCSVLGFQVKGLGFWTDFEEWDRDTDYDANAA